MEGEFQKQSGTQKNKKQKKNKSKKSTGLFGVHVAVVMQVLVVHGEASWEARPQANAEAGDTLARLALHQQRVVEHALRALRHGVHPDGKDDVDDALRCQRIEK